MPRSPPLTNVAPQQAPEMVAGLDQRARRPGQARATRCAVLDVEDEDARSVGSITYKRAAGRKFGIDSDPGDIDAIPLQAIEIDAAEIVIADTTDYSTGLAELAGLIDEDRRRAGRKRPDERKRPGEAFARFD